MKEADWYKNENLNKNETRRPAKHNFLISWYTHGVYHQADI
jgi:hypothetical protein